MFFTPALTIVVLGIAVAGAVRGFYALAAALVVLYAAYLYSPYFTAKRKVKHLPHFTQFISPSTPFVSSLPGSSFYAPLTRPKFRERMDEEFASGAELVGFASRWGPTIYTRSADHIKEMTVTNPWDFPKPTHVYDILKVFGMNIVTSDDGPIHKKHRTVCSPAFSNANLEFSAQVASEQLTNLFHLWESKSKAPYSVNPEEGLFNLTLSIISEAGFGKQFGLTRLEELEKREEGPMQFEEAMKVVSEKLPIKLVVPSFMNYLPIPALQNVNEAFDVFHETLKEVMNSGDQGKKDLISLLVRANTEASVKRQLSEKEIIGDIFMFLFAGHETTAGVLGWTLRLLATHPEAQEKARQEVADLIGDREMITAKEAESLIYCKCIFQETMRLHPVVQVVPKWTEKDTTLGGTEVKKGTLIDIDIKGLHMNPKYWENPEEFQPERFDKRISKPVEPHSFIPFSFGQRNCIGQKLAIVTSTIAIARLVQRYKLSVPKDTPENTLWEEKTLITTRCAHPLEIVFDPII